MEFLSTLNLSACVLPILVATCFHALDFLSGIICAVYNKNVKSGKMRDGLFKKMGFYLCYIVGILFDVLTPYIGIDLGAKVLIVIVCYACVTETISIVENINGINPDLLPKKLLQFLNIQALLDKKEDEENEL